VCSDKLLGIRTVELVFQVLRDLVEVVRGGLNQVHSLSVRYGVPL
jgi:hypothetical protein